MAKSKKTVSSSKKTVAAPGKAVLTASLRTVFGKKLRKLRHTGVVPGNIFGPGFESTAVAIPYREFVNTYKVVKETGIVYLELEKKEIPVLVKNIQRHPVSGLLLHVDFRKIDLKEKIVTEVPVKTVGQSEAVEQKGGVLLTLKDKLAVEALPQDIPHEVEIDITTLKEIGQEIRVGDIKAAASYVFKDEPTIVVVSVTAHKEESVAPETAAVTPEVITEKPAEGEEAPPAAEAPAKEKTPPAAAKEEKGDKKEGKEAKK